MLHYDEHPDESLRDDVADAVASCPVSAVSLLPDITDATPADATAGAVPDVAAGSAAGFGGQSGAHVGREDAKIGNSS